MGQIIMGVMTAAVAGVVAELLPPDGADRLERPLKLVVALLVLCAVVLPLVDAADGGDLTARLDAALDEIAIASNGADAYAEQAMAYIRAASADAAEREITALLAERFGLLPEHCRVEVTLADGESGIALVGVKVCLSRRAILADAEGIEAYLAALFGGQAVVAIE